MGIDCFIRRANLVDAKGSRKASLFLRDGKIAAVGAAAEELAATCEPLVRIDLEGRNNMALLPAFVEPHAHIREPGQTHKENIESALLAASAGGYGALVCMGNTIPVIDTIDIASALHQRSMRLGLCEVYPVLTLTRGMEGLDTSILEGLGAEDLRGAGVRLLSEDGKDVQDEEVFRRALKEAARLGLPVSCHCDAGGSQAQGEKAAGLGREVWSRTEENIATERALRLGQETGAAIHIAHVSTKEALDMIRRAKATTVPPAATTGAPAATTAPPAPTTGAAAGLSCEVSPMHLLLTKEHAEALGAESHGRVNPPLRDKADCQALVAGLVDGSIDMICTDHAPHTAEEKAAGSPGFIGLETSFAALKTSLVDAGAISLEKLSHLMSLAPAHLLGLKDRGLIEPGYRADLVLVDLAANWQVQASDFKSKSQNSPFIGMRMTAKVCITWHVGRPVYVADSCSMEL